MPNNVGCILIHYLYSGTLEHQEALETSLRVYCLAQNYSIDGLAQLAKEQVEQVVKKTAALKVLEMIQRACETFTKDNT